MDRFKSLLEYSEDSIFVLCAKTGRILAANQAACERVHLDEEGLRRHSLDELLPESDGARVRTFFENGASATPQQIVLSTTLQGAGDAESPVELKCISRPQDSDAHVLAIARDSRDDLPALDGPLRRDAQYQLLAENAHDVIWSLNLHDLRFTFFSPSIKRITGLSPEEALTRPLDKSLTPASLEEVMKILREEIDDDEDENTDPNRTRKLELEYLRKDGSSVRADTTMGFLRSSDGHASGIVGVSRDLSEQRAVESRLVESESRYKEILDNIEDGYYEVDLRGNMTFFNAALARMLGAESDALAGLNNRSYMDDGASREVFQYFNAVYRSGKPSKMKDWEVIGPDGKRRIVEGSISLRRNPRGRPIGFAGIVRDITERVRVEEEFRQSQEWMSLLVQHTPLAVVAWDRDFRVVQWNPAAEKIFEYTAAEALGQSALDLIVPPNIKVRIEDLYADLLSERGATRSDNENVTKSGQLIQCVWYNTPLIGKDSTVTGVASLVLDTTERVEAESALRASEKNLADAQRIAHLGSWIWSLPDNRVEWSDETYRIYGLRRGEFDGTIEGFLGLVHPEDREKVEKARKSYELRTRTFVLEHRILRRDGVEITVEQHGEVRVDADTGEITVLGAVLDITDRKQSEAALQHRVEFERLVTSSSAEFASLKSEDLDEGIQRVLKTFGEFTQMDRSYIYQYREGGEIVDNTHEWCAEGIEPEIHMRQNLNIEEESPMFSARVRANKVVYMPDVRDIPPEGQAEREQLERQGIRSVITVPLVARGNVIGFLGFSRRSSAKSWRPEDIVLLRIIAEIFGHALERKRDELERESLKAQIQQAQKLESLGVLAGGIAHDFNNLLTGILGYASLVRRGLGENSKLYGYAEEIEKVATRAADLTNQMLAYSGRGKFLIENIDLSSVIEEMSDLLRMSASKKANLAFSLAHPLPTIEADVSQLQQVLMNLVTNSSDALGEETGAIMISTGTMMANERYLASTYLDEKLSPGNYVYLEVSDSGSGMDEETLSRIFDPFFTTKFTGRGLGLAAILGIVRGHGGTIKLDSKVGKGTSTRILFPTIDESPAVSTAASTVQTAELEPQYSGGTILVVDDEEIVRDLAESVLEEAGYRVLLARDGLEGVKLYKQNRTMILAVLLDLTMPNMDGEETLNELRKIDTDVRVLLSSGYTEDDVTNRFGDDRPTGFIQKPYQSEDLLRMLAATLAH